MVVSVAFLAAAAPLLTRYTPDDMRAGPLFQSPTAGYPFGTDRFGRDVLTRTLYGARISFQISLQVCALAFLFGVPAGLLAGFRGGILDHLLMRLADLLFTLPSVLMALFIAAIIGPGISTVRIALTVVYMPQFLRLSRGAALGVSGREFVTAARSIGARELRIIARHILPNAAAPIMVLTALIMSAAVLSEAALSYLGVGVPPPTPSWGVMLKEGVEQMYGAPYLPIFPGLAVTYLVLGLNLLGDGLRDILDPFFRGRE
jgi:peptide/nickel transport system permease protein